MDSITQAILGASVAGVCAPRGHRRKALIAGAALGTLPDLDVFIDFGDAVRNFTYHRGFSHSLFILAPFSVALWLLLKRWWAPARAAPLRWLAAIGMALLTHPLLDAHTAYGTQLFWPLTVPPAAWGTMFIIDPLYTLPLLAGAIAAACAPQALWSGTTLRAGLALSSLYLGWSWVAQATVEHHARDALASLQLQDARIFSTPMPFNTLLWKVVVLTDDGYLEGLDSLLVDEGELRLVSHPSDTNALREASDIWAVARLRWFAQDFVKARVDGDTLIVSDLRMGYEPTYVFSHAVARRGNPQWKAIPTALIPGAFEKRDLALVWERIWRE